ncbi:MAG: pseudaminic acid synthase [Deltaproteobacteria bacterium]|nr:pseudaminic acid synthase [Deltaproteobacteria bacterium]
MMPSIRINGRAIGPGQPVYVVAEMSANHRQSFDHAAALVRAAKDVGADAVKLQTYTPDTLTIDSDGSAFRIDQAAWAGRTLYDVYSEGAMPWEWQPRLKKLAEELDLELFSTPFDPTAVEFLEGMRVAAHKVASFEIVDLPLLRRIGETGKPVLLSTGMASVGEIDEAVRTLRQAGTDQVVLLKCTSAYPAPPEEMNLRTIPSMAETFGLPVGLSDHSFDPAVPAVAVALGACLLEKHLTLSRADGGPDSSFSLEPEEFRRVVRSVRTAEKALGEVCFGPSPSEAGSVGFRRSLFLVRDLREGELFTAENVRSVRPGQGLAPRYLELVVGRRAARDLTGGTPLTWDAVR